MPHTPARPQTSGWRKYNKRRWLCHLPSPGIGRKAPKFQLTKGAGVSTGLPISLNVMVLNVLPFIATAYAAADDRKQQAIRRKQQRKWRPGTGQAAAGGAGTARRSRISRIPEPATAYARSWLRQSGPLRLTTGSCRRCHHLRQVNRATIEV